MIFQIAGRPYEIDRERILDATDGVQPNAVDGRNKHYVELHGKRFPIKQPVHLVTELPYLAFTSLYAHRVLVNLGFDVYQWAQPGSVPATEKRDSGETMRFAIVLERDEDGYILASCPALPGCHSQGRTREQAVSNIREAIRGYVASMRKHGEPVPKSDVQEIEVAV